MMVLSNQKERLIWTTPIYPVEFRSAKQQKPKVKWSIILESNPVRREISAKLSSWTMAWFRGDGMDWMAKISWWPSTIRASAHRRAGGTADHCWDTGRFRWPSSPSKCSRDLTSKTTSFKVRWCSPVRKKGRSIRTTPIYPVEFRSESTKKKS